MAGRAAAGSGTFHARRLQVPLYSATDTSGLFLSASDVPHPIVRGDSVVATGTIAQYNGLTQLHVQHYRIVDVPRRPPAPLSLTVSAVHGERYEAVPVRVTGRVVDSSQNRGGAYLVLSKNWRALVLGALAGPRAGALGWTGQVDDLAAQQEEAERNPLLKLFEDGGWPMWFLALLSIVAVGIILERVINLNRGSIAPVGLVEKVDAQWKAGDHEGARQTAERDGSVLGQVLAHCAANKDASLAEINESTGDIASRELRRHLQTNYWLAVVATLSPLLGLLGTILGMIKAFDVVAVAGDIGDISLVAEGISQALVTTATGLIIAVPALGFFHIFKVRTNKLAIALEESSSEAIQRWFEGKGNAA